jgi:polysaccharide export outer membrane protein
LLSEDNNLADYRLMRGDIVYVPGPSKFVSMSGQVLHPGTLPLHSTSTLPELIAEAGGPTEKAGNAPIIEVIHPPMGQSKGRIQIIHYNDILKAKPLDLTLQSGDIIFVPESGFNKFAYAVDKMAPLVNLITLGAVLQ